jgi:hypothetical protein
MNLMKPTFLGLSAIGLMALVLPAGATPITGTANIGGGVTVSLTTISFLPPFNTPASIPPFQTGSFTGLTGGTFNVPTLTGGPATGPVFIPDFISFSGGVATPITFDLTNILPGTGTQANCTNGSGNPCTLNGSPFTLIQSPTGVTVDLALLGNSYTGSSSTGSTPTVSLFTTQILMTTCGTTAACLAIIQGGGSITASYSATFGATSVPEPSTMLLMGVGLVGFGSFARRKFKKQ